MEKVKTITYRNSVVSGEPRPALIIEGLWLKQFGFELGKKYLLKIKKGTMSIKLL